MAGSEPTIKRTALTKYDSVPFVRTKEPFKRIGSFANVTSLINADKKSHLYFIMLRPDKFIYTAPFNTRQSKVLYKNERPP